MPADRSLLLRIARGAAGAVLDVRPAAAFAAGHLRGAVSRPLETGWLDQPPARRDAWLQRALPSMVLPPRHAPLAVVASDPTVAAAMAAHLTGRGRVPVQGCAVAPDDLAALPPDLCATGSGTGHLWRPPAFLARWWHLLPPPAAGPVLDLACGSGRAAVWLARRGWRVTGIDHQPEALALARRLAAEAGVPVALAAADLREPAALPRGPWAAVLLLRFLHRPLVTALPDVLRPAGVVMLRTFRDAPGYVGNPRPRHRLGRGEAATLLGRAPGELLVHEEGFDDDGRPAAGGGWRRAGRPSR